MLRIEEGNFPLLLFWLERALNLSLFDDICVTNLLKFLYDLPIFCLKIYLLLDLNFSSLL